MEHLSQNPDKPFYYVISICTVLLLIPNFFAASRTVVRFSMIYVASSQARSSILPFKTQHTPYPDMLHIYAAVSGTIPEIWRKCCKIQKKYGQINQFIAGHLKLEKNTRFLRKNMQ